MTVLIDVIIEMALIILIGFIFFMIYIYVKVFFQKIGLIEEKQEDESEN